MNKIIAVLIRDVKNALNGMFLPYAMFFFEYFEFQTILIFLSFCELYCNFNNV